ncbi:MAG: DUF3152 domain-containing protein [Candidatus Chaera renei]|uniref:DUF3152 domain-containing protein n=1 Tax=Candidatus Chaera renei TaxID=2506947 RepID=A0A4Q0AJJ4_9BACT|nr:MAG: DUF3152 domain-containing protein [Candidatus Chaera renei]
MTPRLLYTVKSIKMRLIKTGYFTIVIIVGAVALAWAGQGPLKRVLAAPPPLPAACQPDKDQLCLVSRVSIAAERLEGIQPSPFSVRSLRVVDYSVDTKGNITADLAKFKAVLSQTLNDPRGWSRLGIRFQEVPSGGQLSVVLAEASMVPSFSAGCDSVYSCTVGNTVIVNQSRWQNASDSWNRDGGSLSDYRHMVINHEVGHWLGHSHATGHAACAGPEQLAPVMMQQSINLNGCRFNPWPLDSELYAPKLGIT